MKDYKLLLCAGLLGTFGFIGLSQETSAANLEMYRLYNPNTGEHFYTASAGERDNLIPLGWQDEGVGWQAPNEGDAVYRLYNPNAGEHFYTLSLVEYNQLRDFGWKQEGRAFYSSTTKDIPVYRLYNPNQFAFNHHYTKEKTESDWLDNIGWNYEGIGWYGAKDEPTTDPTTETFEVTVKYVDETGEEIKTADVATVEAGEDYSVTAPEIEGYTLQGEATQKLTNITKNQTITFTYIKDPTGTFNVTIKYVDESGKEIKSAEVVPVEAGADYTATAPPIYNYTLQGSGTQSLTNITKNQTITFTYKKNQTPPVETVTITVNYIDANDPEKTVKAATPISVEKGKSKTINAENIYGYTLFGDSEQTVVNPQENTELIFKYVSNTTLFKFDPIVGSDENVVIRGFNYAAVTDPVIPTYVVSNGEIKTVTAIGERAFESTPITSIKIPASVTEIHASAFGNTRSLIEVTFEEGSKLETIGKGAFYSSGITSIEIPSSVTEIQYETFYDTADLKTVTFEQNSELTTIGESAFEGSGITSIEVPASVTVIEARAFCDAYSLAEVTFAEGSELETIGTNAFASSIIKSIEIPTSVTKIQSGVFANSGITSIEIPAGVTEIQAGAFYETTDLKTVTFAQNSQLTTIGELAFYNCDIQRITIPTSVTTIGDGAFYENNNMILAVLPERFRNSYGNFLPDYMNADNGHVTLIEDI